MLHRRVFQNNITELSLIEQIEMSNRVWANTPELRSLIAKAEAHGGASEWTLSAEDTTRAFLAEKERLQGKSIIN